MGTICGEFLVVKGDDEEIGTRFMCDALPGHEGPHRSSGGMYSTDPYIVIWQRCPLVETPTADNRGWIIHEGYYPCQD